MLFAIFLNKWGHFIHLGTVFDNANITKNLKC